MTEDSLTLHRLLGSGSDDPSPASFSVGVSARIRSIPSILVQISYLGAANLGRRLTEWAERRGDHRHLLTQIEETYTREGRTVPRR